MSDEQEQDHLWFRERIAAYLSDGLATDERLRFEAHAIECTVCAAELATLREMEQRMNALFAQPAAGLEDRIVQSLRSAKQSWRPQVYIHPAVRRAATGIAAAVMLAGFGYLAQETILRDDATHTKVAANLRQIAAATSLYSNDNRGTFPRTQLGTDTKWFRSIEPGFSFSGNSDGQNVLYGDGHLAWEKNPFVGVNRDNLALNGTNTYKGGTVITGTVNGTSDIKDSVQLPNDSAGWTVADGVSERKPSTPGLTTSGTGTLTISGGTVAANGGTLQVAENDAKKQAGNYYFKASDADGDGIAAIGGVARARGFGGAGVGAGDHAAKSDDFFKPTDFGINRTVVGKEVQVVRQLNEADIKESGKKSDISELGEKPVALAVTAPEAQPAPGQEPSANKPQSTPAPAPVVGQPAPEQPPVTAPASHKVIRNGQLEFEVDRFDSAFATVSKLTTEAGGYVGTTDSEKLPNGKVKGTVTVRVPPDKLDTLILQLRGLGDLKSQKLDANDVTKHYTDLESQLRADRAMEERLLGIIKEGKGQIKDLLAAEKELGSWREKIENIVGEMRYLDSQVAMSTLVVTLYERDIKTPATAQETENIDTGMEVTDVEKARADALKTIEDAKGRVIQSDLKRYDAGQFGATIVADVPADTAGAMLDHLKQIGKLARLDIQRKQTTDANSDSTAPKKVEKKDTRLNLSIYNLANVAPRTTSTMNLAADDVEKTYNAIRERVVKAGGRVISSDLARNKAEKTTGTISFDVPTEQADAVLSDLRAMGEVMRLNVTDNPDVNNVTTAKRGYALQLVASASIAPRETTVLQIAAAKVADARSKILAAASVGGARVLVSQLNESDPNAPTATLDLDVPRAILANVEKSLADAGDVVSRNVTRSSDTENTLDTKVKLQITLLPADRMPPREVTTLTIETSDVESAMANLQLAATNASGKVLGSNESKERDGSTRGMIVVETPLAKGPEIVDQAKQSGSVRAAQSQRNLQSPAGGYARARVEVTFATPETIVQPGTGPLATIRNALSTSFKALMLSLQLIVVGLCTVLPFGIALWVLWKLIKRKKTPMPAT